MSVPLIVCGAAGRMGREIIRILADYPQFSLAAAVEAPGHELLGADAGSIAGLQPLGVALVENLEGVISSDVTIIDFSQPEASLRNMHAAVAQGASIVVGTTGFSPEQQHQLYELGRQTRAFIAANMSVGVALLTKLAELAATILSADFDVEILEMHHRNKVDAPSGTALALARAVAAVRNISSTEFRFGREGRVGPRPENEIGILALRGGDVVGDHTVVFAGKGERLELVHRASSRETFARGALRAALWLREQPPGCYTMRDMLGL